MALNICLISDKKKLSKKIIHGEIKHNQNQLRLIILHDNRWTVVLHSEWQLKGCHCRGMFSHFWHLYFVTESYLYIYIKKSFQAKNKLHKLCNISSSPCQNATCCVVILSLCGVCVFWLWHFVWIHVKAASVRIDKWNLTGVSQLARPHWPGLHVSKGFQVARAEIRPSCAVRV